MTEATRDLLLCLLPLALWFFYSRMCMCRIAIGNTILRSLTRQNERTKFMWQTLASARPHTPEKI